MDISHIILQRFYFLFCKGTVLICVLLITQISAPAQPSYKSDRNTDGILLSTGLASLVASSVLNSTSLPLSADEIASLSRLSVNRVDRPATYLYSVNNARWSDMLVGLSVVSPAGLFLIKDIRLSAGTFSLMYIETILLSTFIPQLCKRNIDRYRPYSYNPEVPLSVRSDPDSRRSFFSGHATSAFASALFLSTVYSNSKVSSKGKSYVWIGSLLTASIMSYLRYASGAHFPTDILTGAVVGAAIGFLVPALHRTSSK